MLFRSRRERNLWLLAGGYTLAVYFSLGSIRTVTDLLRQRNLLRLTIAALFVLAVAAILTWMVHRRSGWREWAVLALAAAGYAALLPLARRPEEQLHLVEYGLMGVLIYAAAAARQRAGPEAAGAGPASSREVGGGPPVPPAAAAVTLPSPATGAAWTAFLLATLLGWIDEGIQDLLPERYYGLQDVVVNAVAAGLAALALVSIEKAGRRQAPA